MRLAPVCHVRGVAVPAATWQLSGSGRQACHGDAQDMHTCLHGPKISDGHFEVGGSPRWEAMSVVENVPPTSFRHIMAAGFTARLMSFFEIELLRGDTKVAVHVEPSWPCSRHLRTALFPCAHLCLVFAHPTENCDFCNSQIKNNQNTCHHFT